MLGSIIGDIVGSVYEWNNCRSKEFPLFINKCQFTDDSIMTCAVAKALLEYKKSKNNLNQLTVKYMQEIGRNYPNCGYGGHFFFFIFGNNPEPYNSLGNGSAMRVSACGWVGNSIEEVVELATKVTEVSHNHPEGIKGGVATAVAIYLARTGKSIKEIKEYIDQNYYKVDFKLDDIRATYEFNETCMNTVPQSLEAFYESTSFEDAIRNAISVGGDSDTLAAITGGIAEAYYGIPSSIRETALKFLDKRLLEIVTEFEKKFPPVILK